MNIEEYRRLFPGAKGKNKYGAHPSGGYDSRKEHHRAILLHALEDVGDISDLREQVKYTLIPTQRDADGCLLERECSYIADFVYRDRAGRLVVEDTKGVRTEAYRIKRKLMLHVHGIIIKET